MKNKKTYEDYQDEFYEDNFKWQMRDIANLYKYENPEWTWKQCWKKARITYIELRKMNDKMWNDNKSYYRLFKPFSFYESEDGTWSSITGLEEI